MIGCTVTSSSFSGRRRMCCALRPAYTQVSRSHWPPGFGSASNESAAMAGGLLRRGEGEEDVVEGRLAAVDVDDVDAGVVDDAHDVDEPKVGCHRQRHRGRLSVDGGRLRGERGGGIRDAVEVAV